MHDVLSPTQPKNLHASNSSQWRRLERKKHHEVHMTHVFWRHLTPGLRNRLKLKPFTDLHAHCELCCCMENNIMNNITCTFFVSVGNKSLRLMNPSTVCTWTRNKEAKLADMNICRSSATDNMSNKHWKEEVRGPNLEAHPENIWRYGQQWSRTFQFWLSIRSSVLSKRLKAPFTIRIKFILVTCDFRLWY